MDIIKTLNWRYATKKFDSDKKISNEDLETLKEVLRLTPSSYGLQAIQYLIVNNPEIREKLKVHSWGQSQVTDASHLLVFCTYLDINDEHIDQHIHKMAEIRNCDVNQFTGYGNFIKKKVQLLSLEEKKNWNSKQAYIALGQLLLACAEMGIDATPMEGFDPDKYDEVLNLKEKNLHVSLVCPIGYRSKEDSAQFNRKVRKSTEELFIEIN